MNKMLMTTTAALFLTAPAFAQDIDFATIDADASGGASYEEVIVVTPDLTEDAFTAADTDQDGALSEEEYAAMVAASQ